MERASYSEITEDELYFRFRSDWYELEKLFRARQHLSPPSLVYFRKDALPEVGSNKKSALYYSSLNLHPRVLPMLYDGPGSYDLLEHRVRLDPGIGYVSDALDLSFAHELTHSVVMPADRFRPRERHDKTPLDKASLQAIDRFFAKGSGMIANMLALSGSELSGYFIDASEFLPPLGEYYLCAEPYNTETKMGWLKAFIEASNDAALARATAATIGGSSTTEIWNAKLQNMISHLPGVAACGLIEHYEGNSEKFIRKYPELPGLTSLEIWQNFCVPFFAGKRLS